MCGAFFASQSGPELGFNRLPREPVAGTKQYPFDICPVAGTVGECLEHNEILGGARVQTRIGEEPIKGRTADHALLERQCAEGDIDRDASLGLKEEHTSAECEFGGIGDASSERVAQIVDVACFIAEAGQARLAPALQRDAADEAEPPSSILTERLDFIRQKE